MEENIYTRWNAKHPPSYWNCLGKEKKMLIFLLASKNKIKKIVPDDSNLKIHNSFDTSSVYQLWMNVSEHFDRETQQRFWQDNGKRWS